MPWIRSLLIAVLLLRVAAGSAWAMPMLAGTPPSQPEHSRTLAAPPCHAMAADITTAQSTAAHGPHHRGVDAHGHGAHCVLCFPAVSSPVTLALAPARHTLPPGTNAKDVPWVRAPELRPPI